MVVQQLFMFFKSCCSIEKLYYGPALQTFFKYVLAYLTRVLVTSYTCILGQFKHCPSNEPDLFNNPTEQHALKSETIVWIPTFTLN